MSGADAEDFAGAVRLHLIEHDYAVLRRFEGRSSLKTYLVAVIAYQAHDWRNARWGKWRASAEARRMGPVAMHLERLVARDRVPFEEAVEVLRTDFRIEESRETLERMAARLPARTGRHFLSEEALETHPASSASAEDRLQQRDAMTIARFAIEEIPKAMSRLDPQDRLILRMRFHDDFSIADIARALRLDQKALYRRVERLLGELRAALQAAGLTAEAAAAALRDGGFDPAAEGALDPEIAGDVRPFQKRGSAMHARTP